ncbi:hypothetical protein Nmel_016065, partial [Mimus melanotis]
VGVSVSECAWGVSVSGCLSVQRVWNKCEKECAGVRVCNECVIVHISVQVSV